MERHFVDLSPKVEEQQLGFLELSENFFGFVDLVFEVDAAVVEALRLVEGRVVESTAQSAGALSPEHLGGGLTLGFYFHQ